MEISRRGFLHTTGAALLLSTGLLTGCGGSSGPSDVTATEVTIGDFKIALENTAQIHYAQSDGRIVNEYKKALVGISIRRLRDTAPINDTFNIKAADWSGGLEAEKNRYALLHGGKMEYKDYGYRQRLSENVAKSLLNLPEVPTFFGSYEWGTALYRINDFRGSLRLEMIQGNKSVYYFWTEINVSMDGTTFRTPSFSLRVEDLATQKTICLQMPFDAAREVTLGEIGL